ncbi:hypothetical protein NEOC65_000111 [Neochlamydia sp. AcF65]|nr:hypothetical protein [Neochlamydia sp. AcF65]MBS4171031.1 hypothetical protein [Neochlamydia sp. AcF95]
MGFPILFYPRLDENLIYLFTLYMVGSIIPNRYLTRFVHV